MADLLSRYGIKEVADVTFYRIDETGFPQEPVLVLDSLKVTSISQTAESTDARGGKGNAKLITWNYNKEITIEITDALFSPKSLAIMFGQGAIKQENLSDPTAVTDYGFILKSARIIVPTVYTASGAVATTGPQVKIDGKVVEPEDVFQDAYVSNATGTGFKWYEAQAGKDEMKEITEDEHEFVPGKVYVARWYHPVKSKSIIEITPDSFPGAYYVTGDTMIRNETTLEDEYFQFVIPKAKMQVEQTIEMSADGDPSTFNMSLEVLRPANGEPMVKFIKYEFYDSYLPDSGVSVSPREVENGWFEPVELGATLLGNEKFVEGKLGLKAGVKYDVTFATTTVTVTAASADETIQLTSANIGGADVHVTDVTTSDGKIGYTVSAKKDNKPVTISIKKSKAQL